MEGPHNLSSVPIPESLCKKEEWRMKNARWINSQEALLVAVSKAFAASRNSPTRKVPRKRAFQRFNYHLITSRGFSRSSTTASMTNNSHLINSSHSTLEAKIMLSEATTRSSIKGQISLISLTWISFWWTNRTRAPMESVTTRTAACIRTCLIQGTLLTKLPRPKTLWCLYPVP